MPRTHARQAQGRSIAGWNGLVRLRDFYIRHPIFDPPFTRFGITLHLSKVREWRTKMDVLYVGGLVLFAALTFALIAGCEKLMQFRRGQGARS
ncbi:hypothetical protein Bxe_A3254 [Paraburkholderia xenovorans LB400]|jgi:hypothetical protein|nr:hypothetical protein Bxe_A3254 [Paraburkholderia xenovorans LB400]